MVERIAAPRIDDQLVADRGDYIIAVRNGLQSLDRLGISCLANQDLIGAGIVAIPGFDSVGGDAQGNAGEVVEIFSQQSCGINGCLICVFWPHDGIG